MRASPTAAAFVCLFGFWRAHAGHRFRTHSSAKKKTPSARTHTIYMRVHTARTHVRGKELRRMGSESEWRSFQIIYIYKNRFLSLCALYGRLQCKQHYPWPLCNSHASHLYSRNKEIGPRARAFAF